MPHRLRLTFLMGLLILVFTTTGCNTAAIGVASFVGGTLLTNIVNLLQPRVVIEQTCFLGDEPVDCSTVNVPPA